MGRERCNEQLKYTVGYMVTCAKEKTRWEKALAVWVFAGEGWEGVALLHVVGEACLERVSLRDMWGNSQC